MIGGGRYAYILLGVCVNDQQCLYLILDPHYIGKDIITHVVEKGTFFECYLLNSKVGVNGEIEKQSSMRIVFIICAYLKFLCHLLDPVQTLGKINW